MLALQHIIKNLLCWLLLTSSCYDDQLSLEGNLGKPQIDRQRIEETKAYSGAVAADDGRCSEIGKDVLVKGGNAVDAAVATAFCLGVVSPASSGIGGGAFMVVRMADGTTEAFDMRETAPAAAHKDMYRGRLDKKKRGALAVAVPGEVKGLYEAWKNHGKRPWRMLIEPAEELARNGFEISPYLYLQLTSNKTDILQDKGLKKMFTSLETNEILQAGEIVYNKKLAWTLGQIARLGPKVFYKGYIGKALVEDIQNLGGIITKDDLRDYEVKLRDPLTNEVNGFKIISMPPPSSGGAAMNLILNILSAYKPEEANSDDALKVHRFIEALKHAFAERMKLGDPDPKFFRGDAKKVVEEMISPNNAEKLKEAIQDITTFKPSYYESQWWNTLRDHGTSHLSVVDKDKNAVSMTTTINAYFGAKILSPSTGIILNNQMDDFTITPDNAKLGGNEVGSPSPAPADENKHRNEIEPGKRPLSSMTPTIVLKDNKLKGVLGASGGVMIIAATTQVFLNYFVDKSESAFASVSKPRVYHQLYPNEVKWENWETVTGDHIEVPRDIRVGLDRRNHELKELTAGGAVTQLIVLADDNKGDPQLVAVSDPRKGGYPAGYTIKAEKSNE